MKENESKIPEFDSLEEEVEFWENHSVVDYLDEFEELDDVIYEKLERQDTSFGPEAEVPNDQIEVNEDVMMGKPVIKDTRITVEQILRKLSQAVSVDELLDDYPNLSRKDINTALKYAANYIQEGKK